MTAIIILEETESPAINTAVLLNLFVITLEPINKNSGFLVTSPFTP